MAVKIWDLVLVSVRVYAPGCPYVTLFSQGSAGLSPVQVVQFPGLKLRPLPVDRQGRCCHLEVQSQSLARL